MIQGCVTLSQVYGVSKVVKRLGCTHTSTEWRTEVREGQTIKTNVCQDDVTE